MNIFRFAGDMVHLLSFLILLLKIRATKSCRGISMRTQELYTLVFVCRYLDLFTHYVSLYNLLMKLVFLAASFTILYYMKYHKQVRHTYDKEQDTFRRLFLVVPAAVLGLALPYEYTFREMTWAFSIYLEAVAILPQLVLLQRTQNIDNLTGNYIALLGTYRGLYILNWIYRYFVEPPHRMWLESVSGIIQTAIYADFFYYYILAWRNNEKLKLPE